MLNTRALRPTAATPLAPAGAVVEDSVLELKWRVSVAQVLEEMEEALPLSLGLSDEFAAKFRGSVALGLNVAGTPGWTRIGTAEDGLLARYRAIRSPFRIISVGQGLVFESAVLLSAISAKTLGSSRSRVGAACGCDGSPWCGGRKGAPLEVLVRGEVGVTLDGQGHPGPTVDWQWVPTGDCLHAFVRGGESHDIQRLVLNELQSAFDNGFVAASNSILNQLNWPHSLEAAWHAISRPVSMENSQKDTLALRPLTVYPVSFTLSSAEELEATVPLAVRPKWTATTDNAVGTDARPDLAIELPEASAGLRLVLPGSVPVADIAEGPRAAVVGRDFSTVSHHTARVSDVDVFGSRGRTGVRVRVEGTLPGYLYLLGDLRVSDDGRRLAIEDLDFTNSTKAAMSILFDEYHERDYTAARIYWFDAEGLRAAIQASSSWPIVERAGIDVALLNKQLQALSTSDLRVNAQLEFKQLSVLSIDGEALRWLAVAGGELVVEHNSGPPLPNP